MSETTPEIKTKISFSVESLLSSNNSSEEKIEEGEGEVEDEVLSEEEEHIEVDDVDSRESESPGGAGGLVVPQPLHPSVPRGLFSPQWPFTWIGPAGPMYRSSSPQCKYGTRVIFTIKKRNRA